MKILTAVLILGFAPALFAQEHASLADQKACYDQAQKYVHDINDDMLSKNRKRAELNTAFGSHYDVTSKICYVRYGLMEDSAKDTVTFTDNVDDAFEQKHFAGIVYSRERETVKTSVMICMVGAKQCESFDEYQALLFKAIPAFKPIEVKK